MTYMNNINEYLSSKLKRKPTIPEIGKKAYDWYDEEWTIVDFCCCDDEQKLKKFMHDYDADSLDVDDYGENDYLVAAENGKVITVFYWDEDSGLHYK